MADFLNIRSIADGWKRPEAYPMANEVKRPLIDRFKVRMRESEKAFKEKYMQTHFESETLWRKLRTELTNALVRAYPDGTFENIRERANDIAAIAWQEYDRETRGIKSFIYSNSN
jgi:hypothetical protein